MSETVSKDFKVKHGLVVAEGGTFNGTVSVATPTSTTHATTKSYVDDLVDALPTVTVSNTEPLLPDNGDLWLNSVTLSLSVYSSPSWLSVSSGSSVVTSATAPASPEDGDIWLETTTEKLYVYYNNVWVDTTAQGEPGRFIVSATAPANPVEGDAWFDTVAVKFFMYYDGAWIEVGSSQDGMDGVASAVAPLQYNATTHEISIDLSSYYTSTQTDTAISSAIAGLVDSAPTTLDTLNEIAAALADDANFAATITSQLADKASLSGATFTGDVSVQSSAQYPKLSVKSTAANGYGILSYNRADGNGFDLTYDNTNDSLAINRFVGGAYNSTPVVISPGNILTLPSTTSIGNVSSTELGYLDGVSSAIQGQIDAKAPTASQTFTGVVTAPTLSLTPAGTVSLTDGTGNIQIGANGTTNMGIDPNDIQVRNNGAGAQFFINRLGGQTFINDGAANTYINRNGGDVFIGDSTVGLGVTAGQVWATGIYGNSLTTSYRSMYVSSTDTYDKLGYVASSRREKKNIEPLEYTAEQILSVEPVQYHYNAEDDSAPKHPGMIAEDLHEAGLHGFVSYDTEGLPASINYEFYVSALQAVVREQASQIASLSARLDALENS